MKNDRQFPDLKAKAHAALSGLWTTEKTSKDHWHPLLDHNRPLPYLTLLRFGVMMLLLLATCPTVPQPVERTR